MYFCSAILCACCIAGTSVAQQQSSVNIDQKTLPTHTKTLLWELSWLGQRHVKSIISMDRSKESLNTLLALKQDAEQPAVTTPNQPATQFTVLGDGQNFLGPDFIPTLHAIPNCIGECTTQLRNKMLRGAHRRLTPALSTAKKQVTVYDAPHHTYTVSDDHVIVWQKNHHLIVTAGIASAGIIGLSWAVMRLAKKIVR